MLLVGGMHPVDDRLDSSLQDGQRGSQFVPQIGEERTAPGVLGLETLGHPTERRSDCRERAWAPAMNDRPSTRPITASRIATTDTAIPILLG